MGRTEFVKETEGADIKEGSSCVQILRETPGIKETKGSFWLMEEEGADHIKEAEGAERSTEIVVEVAKGAECAREGEGAGVVNETWKGDQIANPAFSACRGPSLSNRLWTSLLVILH